MNELNKLDDITNSSKNKKRMSRNEEANLANSCYKKPETNE